MAGAWSLHPEVALVPSPPSCPLRSGYLLWTLHAQRVPSPNPLCDSLCFAPSAQRQGLHDASGRSHQDIQLPPAAGVHVRPYSHHPGHPPDGARPSASARRAVLPAHQADQQGAPPGQRGQPLQLADPHLPELHLPAQPRDPQVPQVPPEKVWGGLGRAAHVGGAVARGSDNSDPEQKTPGVGQPPRSPEQLSGGRRPLCL